MEPTQFRLAVVMSGGVSLCVWMGGAALEIDCVRRAADPPQGGEPRSLAAYRSLAAASGLVPMVDIIAGTSAGGLNGTLLGGAIAWGASLQNLRDLWLQIADFDALLRPMSQADPPSLLQGDGYFLPKITETLETLRGQGASMPPPLSPGLHVIATTTLIRPSVTDFEDSLGSQFSESDNLGLFHFVRDEQTNHFDLPNAPELLGRAARSSASFPTAFEPSFVNAPDMVGITDFDQSRFVLDGGLMDNEPIAQVLTLVADQPAPIGTTRRTMVFVSPLENRFSEHGDEQASQSPTVVDILADTLLIPRQQSVVAALQSMRLRSQQHTDLRHVRSQLFQGGRVNAAAVRHGSDLAVAADCLRPGLELFRDRDVPEHRLRPTLDRSRRQARQNLLTVQDLLRRSLDLDIPTAEIGPARIRVSLAQRALIDPSAPDEVTQHAASAAAAAMVAICAALDLHITEDDEPERPSSLQVEVAGIAGLAEARELFPASTQVTDSSELVPVEALRDESWDAALTDLDTLQSVVTDSGTHNPQEIDLVVLSAAVTDPLWPKPPAQKLTGVQLSHFGAFYLRSWRQNDWIWGRLDGSYRLIELLIDPERLVAGHGPAGAAQLLEANLSATDPGDRAEFVREATVLLEAVAARGTDPAAHQAAVTRARSELARRIAQDVHYEILVEELPTLAMAVQHDLAGGALMTTTSDGLVDQINRVFGPTAASDTPPASSTRPSREAVFAVWGSCEIGQSTIRAEFGSDHFAELSTRAAGVAVNLVRGVSGPAKGLLGTVSYLLRAAHFLTTPASATRTSRLWLHGVSIVAAIVLLVCANRSLGITFAVVAGVVLAAFFLAALVLGEWPRALFGGVVVLGGLGLALWAHAVTRPTPLLFVGATSLTLVGALVLSSPPARASRPASAPASPPSARRR